MSLFRGRESRLESDYIPETMSLFRGRESRLESDYIPETIEEWVLNIPTMLDARVAISMNDKDLADDALGIIIFNLGFSILIIQAKATTGGGWQSIIPPSP